MPVMPCRAENELPPMPPPAIPTPRPPSEPAPPPESVAAQERTAAHAVLSPSKPARAATRPWPSCRRSAVVHEAAAASTPHRTHAAGSAHASTATVGAHAAKAMRIAAHAAHVRATIAAHATHDRRSHPCRHRSRPCRHSRRSRPCGRRSRPCGRRRIRPCGATTAHVAAAAMTAATAVSSTTTAMSPSAGWHQGHRRDRRQNFRASKDSPSHTTPTQVRWTGSVYLNLLRSVTFTSSQGVKFNPRGESPIFGPGNTQLFKASIDKRQNAILLPG